MYALHGQAFVNIETEDQNYTKTSPALEDKILSFQRFLIQLHRQYGNDVSQIGNMDEMPVTFDLPGNQTVNAAGAKTIPIKTMRNPVLQLYRSDWRIEQD